MPHEYIDWYGIKDPHPSALPNLQKIVTYMIAEKAVHNAHTLSIYKIAKFLDKQHKQAASLLRGRPGFVEVYRDGKMQGYYYDYVNFSDTYPNSYRDLKRTRVLLSEDVKESNAAVVKEFNDNFQVKAKELRAESLKPDIELPKFTDQRDRNLTISFSHLPVEIAKDLLQVSVKEVHNQGLNEELASDILTSLLSLLANTKDNSANVQ